MFSIGSSSSISFATVTPSFVTCGAPNFFSITTLRPFGPSVTLTAFASVSTPFFILLRASISKYIIFAILYYPYLQVRYETCGVEQDFNLELSYCNSRKELNALGGNGWLYNCQNITLSHN